MMMTRIEVSPNFYLDEFLDPHTYLFDKDNGLDKLDFRLFQIAQKVRELYDKPLFINTWWERHLELKEMDFDKMKIVEAIEKDDSIRKWSGLRTDRCKIGSSLSAHKIGKAIDLKGDGDELYDIVKDNAKDLYFLGLRRIEDKKITRTWLHADTWERNTQPNSIRVVDLKKATETIYF